MKLDVLRGTSEGRKLIIGYNLVIMSMSWIEETNYTANVIFNLHYINYISYV